MLVRALTVGDDHSIKQLLTMTDDIAPMDSLSHCSGDVDSSRSPEASWLNRLGSDSVMLGAVSGAELVGVASLRRNPLPGCANQAHISGVFVAPARRRMGVGTRLMQEVIRYARTRGDIASLHLSVDAANTAALRLYRSLDFVAAGYETASIFDDNDDAFELQLRLELIAKMSHIA
jgi:ribosomal protein S18 acetylase RimI-like enzyme